MTRHFFFQLSLSVSYFFMNWVSNVACVLLNIYKYHHTETLSYLLYLYTCLDLGLFMLYLCDLFFIFIFILIMINRIISWIQTHLFVRLFSGICPIIFAWRMWKIFKQQKLSLGVLLSICLNFWQFQPAFAYVILQKLAVVLPTIFSSILD